MYEIKANRDFSNWLAGFIDGEGCFIVSLNSSRRGQNYACLFKLALRDDDAPILDEIVLATGVGSVLRGRATGGGNPKATWTITSKAGCVALMEILDEHPLRAKKRRDYEIWREAVLWWVASGNGTRGRDWTPMADARDELRRVRTYQEA